MNHPLSWRTEKRRVNDLVPHGKNPRRMSEKQLDDLKRSIEKFNLVELPACDADGTILAGHQRMKVLQILGRGDEEIEVRLPNRPLTAQEREQYLLTSNAVHGEWDYDLLRNFDTDLLLSIGFGEEDLSRIFDDALETEDDGFDVEEELKKITEPTVKPGELYQLGSHRLMCADSRDLASIKKLVGDERIDLVNTDSPYNISLRYDGTKGQYGGSYKDNKSDEEFHDFLRSLIANALAVCKENAHLFFWCDERYIGMIQGLYRELGIDSKRVLIWVKGGDNPTPQIAWNKSYEPVIYGTIGKPYLAPNVRTFNEFMNREFGNGARLIEDIGDLFDLWLVRRLPSQEYQHPTQKPATLHEKALRRCTKPGDAVLDLTAGSGSLMIAAEQMKRRAFLSEVDPVFATLIINRYEKLTGDKAKRIS